MKGPISETRMKSDFFARREKPQKVRAIATDQKVRGSNPLSRAKKAIPFGMAFLAYCDRDSNVYRNCRWQFHPPVRTLEDSLMFRTARCSSSAHPFPCETCKRIPYRVKEPLRSDVAREKSQPSRRSCQVSSNRIRSMRSGLARKSLET